MAEGQQVADLVVAVVALLDHLRPGSHPGKSEPVQEVVLVAALFLPHAVDPRVCGDAADVARRVVFVRQVDQPQVARLVTSTVAA